MHPQYPCHLAEWPPCSSFLMCPLPSDMSYLSWDLVWFSLHICLCYLHSCMYLILFILLAPLGICYKKLLYLGGLLDIFAWSPFLYFSLCVLCRLPLIGILHEEVHPASTSLLLRRSFAPRTHNHLHHIRKNFSFHTTTTFWFLGRSGGLLSIVFPCLSSHGHPIRAGRTSDLQKVGGM